ncbi:MAG: hypothetical protein II979_00540, partial [Clostridia bacterium]|nr:hypothetical protein [Clostridia bacterium]
MTIHTLPTPALLLEASVFQANRKAMSDLLRVNVRTLAEFYTEGGDLISAGNAMERMREGIRGHQTIQSRYA